MMLYNVSHLLKSTIGASKNYMVNEQFAPLEDVKTTKVLGKLRLMRIEPGIWMTGDLEANAFCTCSRCLNSYELSINLKLSEIYTPVVNARKETDFLQDNAIDTNYDIDEHNVLEITESVRQSVLVTLPMKPLCTSNCAGICQECGTNLNESHCTCQPITIDSRWMPLLSYESNKKIRSGI